ncbi:MAG: lysophospholipase [Ruminococcaceae bacterium]|nr:lysophospholipase [Oscillospiraceae bacterium]
MTDPAKSGGATMKHILFQGDSITDSDRNRTWDIDLGKGYPLLVSGSLGFAHPGRYRFSNKGISGNRIVDLYARIKCDIINLQPDVLSILVGVNDAGHEYGSRNGVSAEKYGIIYDLMIREILSALPQVRIMILEPFVLEGEATQAHWPAFYTEVAARARQAKMIAEKYNLTYVPLQTAFETAAAGNSNEYWLRDGIHPTPAGHELIRNAWLEAFRSLEQP